MKRKLLSIFIALVLALSLCLVTAVPVAAQGTLEVVPFSLEQKNDEDASASWSALEGEIAVLLDSGPRETEPVGGDGDEGRIVIDTLGATLGSLESISWEEYLLQGYAPHVDVIIKVDGGTDALVVEYAYNNSLASTDGQSNAYGCQAGAWYTTFDDDEEGAEAVTSSSNAWLSSGAAGGTPVGGTIAYADVTGSDFVYGTLADWTEGTVVAEIGADTPIVRLEIEIDNWIVESEAYVDNIEINGVTYYGSIQDAIDSASAGDTINVAEGTYVEDLSIPADKINLELVGAEGAVIKGDATWIDEDWPYTVPNIDILASGVKIHGFTIEGPVAVLGEYASGMLIGAPNVEIYDNDFKVTAGKDTIPVGEGVSQAIQTWRQTVEGFYTVDISGLNIHDNTFTNLGIGAAGYEGIFVNLDTGEGIITIADNDFTGNIYRAVSVERSNVVISGNSIITDLAPYVYVADAGGYQGMYIGCFLVEGEAGPVQTNVSITGNTVGGSAGGLGFVQGIRVGSTTALGFEGIVVSQNTVQYNTDGIVVKAPADAPVGVVINYNNIVDNTNLGVNNYTVVPIDATKNWWGAATGPQDAGDKNPYSAQAETAEADTCSANVDFTPWMIHTDLVSGWNIYSTPIACGDTTDTISEALDLWTADSTKVTAAYYFDGSSQAFTVTTATNLTPLQAVYLNMSAAATIDVISSTLNTAPPSQTVYAGWNLVGPAQLYSMQVDAALATAYYVAGDNNIGWGQVVSPGLGQTAWSGMRGATIDTGSDQLMLPTEGYWVNMVNQGILAGFTSTPITEVP